MHISASRFRFQQIVNTPDKRKNSLLIPRSTKDSLCPVELLPRITILNLHVHFFIVETAQPCNSAALQRRSSIKPHNILVSFAIYNYIIVLCLPFVGTLCRCLAGSEHRSRDGGQGYIVPHRQPSLVELHTSRRFSNDGALERDTQAA